MSLPWAYAVTPSIFGAAVQAFTNVGASSQSFARRGNAGQVFTGRGDSETDFIP